MRRDLDVIREILLQAEADDSDPHEWVTVVVPEKTKEQISYHIEMLYEAGFLHAVDCSSMDGHDWQLSRLKWNGHELLDSIRDDNIWRKTKDTLTKAGGWTLPILQAVAADILKKQLGMT